MDLKTLKTFQLIVQYGSFARAAKEMNYAQSTVTMQIQKLEAELGVRLIERGKGFRLTEAGRLFHDQSAQIVQNMDNMQASLAGLKSGEAGHVRIGVTEPAASYRLPALLGDFMAAYPNIGVSLEIANTPALRLRVLEGELDFALCSAPDGGDGLYFEPLYTEEFVMLLPEGHALAQFGVVSPEELRGHRLLVTSATCPYRRKLEMVLQETGGLPLTTMEIGSMTALKAYVEQGLGVALVPRIMAEPIPAGTAVRELSGSLIGMASGILCRTSAYPLQPAGRRLYQFLKQELRIF